jgi:hypothetical protein
MRGGLIVPTVTSNAVVIPDARSAIRNRFTVAGMKPMDSRHPWRSRYAPPAAFAFAVLQTQSGCVRDEATAGPGMTNSC